MQPVNTILSPRQNINSELAGLSPSVAATVEVDLAAIQHNFRFLQKQLTTARCGAVVKANAYGLGMKTIAPTLAAVDCQDFFVATIDEALELRTCLPLPEHAAIYVLNGLLPGTEHIFSQHHFIPVLNDIGQIVAWQNHAKILGQTLPAVVHFDTGMCRLGLSPEETARLVEETERLEGLKIAFYMSHLACGDQPDHPQNDQQLRTFQAILQALPKAPASLANSHGIFLSPGYHFDLVRPGRGLYGLEARSMHNGDSRPAVRIFAKVIQLRSIKIGQPIGYDATFVAPQAMKIATLGIGYADGLHRTLTNRGAAYINGVKCPIVGRVSMDLTVIDVSHVPEALLDIGMWAEIIGDYMSADDIAQAAGTTSRELLVHLGSRIHRIYKGANEA